MNSYSPFIDDPLSHYINESYCNPPPQPSPASVPVDMKDHHHGLSYRAVLVISILSAFLFISLLSSALLFFLRRLRRRRTGSTPSPTPSSPSLTGGDQGDDPIHHVWYIRTVGLDEATIESIAVTEYRAGAGLLGAADCSVCLGEFHDGDLVRLLPKCGHAFHVNCIDTWLRAHVNCPLCRADVVDPQAAAAAGDSTSASSVTAGMIDNPDLEAQSTENGDEISDGETEGVEEQEVFDEIPLTDSPAEIRELRAQSDPDETAEPPTRRRAASVDSPFVGATITVVVSDLCPIYQCGKESNSQKEQCNKEKEKQGTPSKSSANGEIERSLSSSSGRSFFFSRNGRSRSSILPL